MSRIRSDKIVNLSAEGAPQLSFGAEVPVGYGITGGGGLNLTGISTLGQCDFVSGTKIESSGSFKVEDNSLLKVGTDNDLQIYHSSGKSYITNTTGILEVKSQSGNIELWQGNNKRFETTDSGGVVSGILTATTFSGDGSNLTGLTDAGAWQLISTITANGASTVDFTSGIDSTYRRYVILGSEIQSTVGNPFLYMRVYENGSLYQSNNYNWGNAYYADYAVGAAYDVINLNQGASTGYISLSNQNGGLQYPSTLELIIDNPSTSKTHYKINSKLECGPASNQTIVWSSGSLISSSALTNVDGIQLYPNSQTINGTFKLYGIK